MKTNSEILSPYGLLPFEYGMLKADLVDYLSPKDKINVLAKEGSLIRLKQGLYIASSEITGQPYPQNLIANHLYGPSYVSLETALAFYGMIPEGVRVVRSVTVKKTKVFQNDLGRFEYNKASYEYYSVGLVSQEDASGYSFLIASPEKALCDILYFTRGLRIQSKKALREFLFEDMRIDFSFFKNPAEVSAFSAEEKRQILAPSFNPGIIEDMILLGKKTMLFTLLLEVMQDELNF